MKYRDERGNKRSIHPRVQQQEAKETGMTAGRLVFVGIASIVGAGFFLATSSIFSLAGPATLFGYGIAWLVVATVIAALGEMVADEPGYGGSFRLYAEEHLGRGVAFVIGWTYWLAGVLIMSSEVTALGLFVQRWFPHWPLWLLVAVFALLALGLNLLGTEKFGKVESLFAVIKIAALIGFVIAAIVIYGGEATLGRLLPHTVTTWFPNGLTGLWSAMILIFFTFGGIEVTGMAAGELRNPAPVPSAFRRLMILLLILYLLPLTLVVLTKPLHHLSPQESPFITVLSSVPFAGDLLNGVMIAAAFSTMVAAMFAVARVLLSLAEDGDAPSTLLTRNRRGVPMRALFASSGGLIIAVGLSFFLPKEVYELLSTSAGINLVLVWLVILWAHHNYKRQTRAKKGTHPMWGYPWRNTAAAVGIFLVLAGSLLERRHLISFLFSLGALLLITIGYRIKLAQGK
ncbi:amino acid permease [Desmospora activa]|uniref:L-asparagine transporter-like permease n=1 Tax=Desmospora activa DSM 45169 TaxID=1121389 RepID=A0A2T4ZCY0_9BACL|nr:amino acid permease [Desmospora activa]PTM59754.1 L-asparagine transporter-like permease [Desmospora activa DSM 45169]